MSSLEHRCDVRTQEKFTKDVIGGTLVQNEIWKAISEAYDRERKIFTFEHDLTFAFPHGVVQPTINTGNYIDNRADATLIVKGYDPLPIDIDGNRYGKINTPKDQYRLCRIKEGKVLQRRENNWILLLFHGLYHFIVLLPQEEKTFIERYGKLVTSDKYCTDGWGGKPYYLIDTKNVPLEAWIDIATLDRANNYALFNKAINKIVKAQK
jgi:hypothetical protein